MSVPVLEFFNANWVIVPVGVQTVQFKIIASPPVAANVGIVVFAKPTSPAPGQPDQWTQIGRAEVDNIPNTLPGPGFNLPVKQGTDYVIRFQGEAHLLMPGFQTVTVGFDLAHAGGPLSNFDGPKTANNARAAGINGNAYLRCA